jgi:hypothetical protein
VRCFGQKSRSNPFTIPSGTLTMNKTLALALLLSAPLISAFGQSRYATVRHDSRPAAFDPTPRFGLKAGVNFANALVSPEPMNFVRHRTDFQAGLFADIPFSERVGLQPELLYSRQGFNLGGNSLGTVSLHYLSVPVLLKLRLTDGLSVLAGPQVSYLANARIGVLGNLFSINYDGAFQKWDASLVGDLQYELPNGLSLGARYVYGLNNINKDFSLGGNDASARSLNDYFTLRNSVAQVSVGYKF